MENAEAAADPLQLWQHIHGASSHFPIVLIIMALLFDLGATVFRRDHWRLVGFWCLIIGALGTIPAVLSGLAGANGWFGVEWSGAGFMDEAKKEPIVPSLANHRLAGLIASGIFLLLALWRAIRRDRMKGIEWGVYLLILLFTCLGIGYAGWLGGYVGHGY